NASGAALGAAAAGSIAPLSSPARAQEKFPARDISWIIYQAPGGSIDTTARIIQPYLEKQGVKTSLDYVLGAGGRVARTKLYTARPLLLLFFIGIVALSYHLPFDARLFPIVIGSAGILLTLGIAVEQVRRRGARDASMVDEDDPAAKADWPRYATALLAAP